MNQLKELLNKCIFIEDIILTSQTSVTVSTGFGQFLIKMDFNRIEEGEMQNATVFNRGAYKKISWIPIWPNKGEYFVSEDFKSKSLSEAILDVEEQLQNGKLAKQIFDIIYHNFEDFKSARKKGKGEIHYLFEEK